MYIHIIQILAYTHTEAYRTEIRRTLSTRLAIIQFIGLSKTPVHVGFPGSSSLSPFILKSAVLPSFSLFRFCPTYLIPPPRHRSSDPSFGDPPTARNDQEQYSAITAPNISESLPLRNTNQTSAQTSRIFDSQSRFDDVSFLSPIPLVRCFSPLRPTDLSCFRTYREGYSPIVIFNPYIYVFTYQCTTAYIIIIFHIYSYTDQLACTHKIVIF